MDSFALNTLEDKIKFVDDANNLLWSHRGVPNFDIEKLVLNVQSILDEIDYQFGKGKFLLTTGIGVFITKNDGNLSLKMMNDGLEIFKHINNKKWIANAHASIGIIYNSLGNPELALYNALRSLDYYLTNTQIDEDKIMIYYVLGTVYKDLGKYDESEKHYLSGISCNEIESSSWGGRVYTGLAGIYIQQKKFNEALNYSLKALEILKLEENTLGQSRAYTDIGIIYKKLNNYSESLYNLNEGLKIREKHNIKPFIITSYMELASLQGESNELKEAINYLEKAENLAIEINHLPKLSQIYKELYSIFKSTGDFENALFYSEKNLTLNTEIHKKEVEQRLKNMQHSIIKEKEDEIERLKNVELKNAYLEIEEKNKEIMDSIHYAKRIQLSLLPTEKYIDKNLKRLKK